LIILIRELQAAVEWSSVVAVSRIFLSDSSANNAEAIAIRDWMIAHGWDDVFLDLDPERGLKAGERWQEALKRAAERCELVVFLVSPVWAASKWCLAEFLLAKSLNKRVFAVIVEPTPFSELPTEMTAEWQITDLTAGTRDFHATVTLPGGETTNIAFGTEGLDRLRIGLVQSGLDPKHFTWPPANDQDRPPYRGLLPLEADDAGIFFGREAPVIDALDRLRGLREAPPPRLLVILGASGAGKSSFLRAGLLPRLARDDRQFLVLPIIRPQRVAISGETGLLRALEGAFGTANLSVARANLRAAIEGGATKLGALLSLLAPTRPSLRRPRRWFCRSTRARSCFWPSSRRRSPSLPCCATSSRPMRRPSSHCSLSAPTTTNACNSPRNWKACGR